MCSAVAKPVGGPETRPPDYRALWDPYKARFLKVYKGSMRRRFFWAFYVKRRVRSAEPSLKAEAFGSGTAAVRRGDFLFFFFDCAL